MENRYEDLLALVHETDETPEWRKRHAFNRLAFVSGLAWVLDEIKNLNQAPAKKAKTALPPEIQLLLLLSGKEIR